MQISNRNILFFLMIVSLILVPLFYWTSGIPRIICTLLVILFIPGYSFLCALFPQRSAMTVLSRLALSFGMSIGIVSLTGLSIHLAQIINLSYFSMLFSTLVLILIFSTIAFFRDYRLQTNERISFKLKISLPAKDSLGRLDKGLYMISAFAILGLIITFIYVAFSPTSGEKYSEFYILNAQGIADNYPKQIKSGEAYSIIVGVTNDEEQSSNYIIKVEINDQIISEISTGTLNDKEKWEKVVNLLPRQTGLNQQIQFWLYKNGEEHPYNKDALHLFIDVLP
jgi:uncharacterized membrane protein